MQIIHECGSGVDVHAKTAVTCLRRKDGSRVTRTYSTMTADLLALLDWLLSEGCTHVAIESTGVYWRPVYNILEGSINVILVNARHMKAVPGRKTDVKDCEWLADLLCHGLLKPSFIPPREIREVRELTRYRHSLIDERTRIANRIQKVIESGNIKLGQVATDVLGVSGRKMLHMLADGETNAEVIASVAQKRLKDKDAELQRALTGRLTESQRWVLSELLQHYDELESSITRVQERIEKELAKCEDPFVNQAVQMLDNIPGVGRTIAEQAIAEIGVDMSRFPSERHLCSWAALCPGNNESAGKRKSGKTMKGNPYLRSALIQAAWAASRTKGTYLSAQYHRLIRRLGKKKALVAVAHSILVIIYHMLSQRKDFVELGGDYFDHRNTQQQQSRLVHRLEALGLKVTVEPRVNAA